MITISKRDEHGDLLVKLDYKQSIFPGGEVFVRLDTSNLKYLYAEATHQTIVARLQNSVDVMELAMVRDALVRFDPTPIHLFLPCVPYARQDRVCYEGESFSVLAFARLIKGMGFEQVTIVDPHSEVTPAVIDAVGLNVKVISHLGVIHKFRELTERVLKGVVLVSPDAGSNKKVSDVAKYYNHASFLRADKLRNLATGQILETVVYSDDLTGCNALICDDLCDAGGTFIGLAKVLKAKGTASVMLYVSHGLFSKGVDNLLKNGIDHIFTTDSFGGSTQWNLGPQVTTLRLEETFKV